MNENFTAKDGMIHGAMSVIRCGFSEPSETRLHSDSSSYLVEYLLSGTETAESPDYKIDVRPGGVLFVPASDECVIYHPVKDYKALFVEFDGALADAVCSVIGCTGTVVRYLPIYDRFFKISELCEKSAPYDTQTSEEICTVLFSVLLSIASAETAEPKKLTAEKIRQKIDMSLFAPIELEDIAEYFGVTKIHIIRVFKEKYDMTPMQYLKEARLLNARRLLSEGEMSIKSIASLLNYKGTQHFTNLFRERFGTSPGKYRRENKSK